MAKKRKVRGWKEEMRRKERQREQAWSGGYPHSLPTSAELESESLPFPPQEDDEELEHDELE